MTVGIVIPYTPLYSETFFETEINLLRSIGIDVLLFVWQKDPSCTRKVKTYQEVHLSDNLLFKTFQVIYVLLHALLSYPRRLVKYYMLVETKNKRPLKFIRLVIANHHIMKVRALDWLHFGYISMTKNRELLAKVIDTKLAVSIRGADIGVDPISKPGCYNKLWPYVDKLRSPSMSLINKAIKLGMSPELEYDIIAPSLSTHFKPIEHKNFGFKKGKPIKIITIGRLHWKKGLDLTIKALASIKAAGINFSYTIIGEGEEREHLLFEIDDLNLVDSVHLLGKVSHAKVQEYLKESDISINYSLQEGFCIAALEAQAMGVLCVVSDAEGLEENVEHEKSGWVIPRRQPKLLAKKLIDIFNRSEEELIKVSQYASRRAQSNFSHDIQREQLRKFYKVGDI